MIKSGLWGSDPEWFTAHAFILLLKKKLESIFQYKKKGKTENLLLTNSRKGGIIISTYLI